MKIRIFLILFSLLLLSSQSGYATDAAMERRVTQRYGERYVQSLKKLQSPGILYPGKSQDKNEENDEGAMHLKKMSDNGIQNKSATSSEMIKEAIAGQRQAMEDVATQNKDMDALKPLKTINKYKGSHN